MEKELEFGNIMIFSHIVTVEGKNKPVIKNTPDEKLSGSIMIDVLLMLLCEQSDNQALQDSNLNLE